MKYFLMALTYSQFLFAGDGAWKFRFERMNTSADSMTSYSTAKAIGFSALFPGLGQFYIRNGRETWIKGTAFSILEIANLVLYSHYESKGDSRERKFKRYADRNWDVDKYLVFLENSLVLQSGSLGRKSSGINIVQLEAAELNWSGQTGVANHYLYRQGKQQYYEVIYKYPEQFGQAWSDADGSLITPRGTATTSGYTRANLTSNMKKYRTMRNQSNSWFDIARTMTSLMLVNRALSIVDIVWMSKRKHSTAMSLRFAPNYADQKLTFQPMLNFNF